MRSRSKRRRICPLRGRPPGLTARRCPDPYALASDRSPPRQREYGGLSDPLRIAGFFFLWSRSAAGRPVQEWALAHGVGDPTTHPHPRFIAPTSRRIGSFSALPRQVVLAPHHAPRGAAIGEQCQDRCGEHRNLPLPSRPVRTEPPCFCTRWLDSPYLQNAGAVRGVPTLFRDQLAFETSIGEGRPLRPAVPHPHGGPPSRPPGRENPPI
jgi:hypothetical protein